MFLWFPSIFPGFSHGSSHQSVASVAALGQSQSGIAAVNNGQRKRSRWNQGCVAWGEKAGITDDLIVMIYSSRHENF